VKSTTTGISCAVFPELFGEMGRLDRKLVQNALKCNQISSEQASDQNLRGICIDDPGRFARQESRDQMLVDVEDYDLGDEN
jgi:hypothetical protein